MSKGNRQPQRDLIGTVQTSYGDIIEVYMPTIGDILDGPSQGLNNFETLIVTATNMTMQEFRSLPFPDGAAVISKLNVAFEAMSLYTGQSSTSLDKKH